MVPLRLSAAREQTSGEAKSIAYLKEVQAAPEDGLEILALESAGAKEIEQVFKLQAESNRPANLT